MPVTCRKRDGKWRVVEASTGRIAKKGGKAVDGGGHRSREACARQSRAINRSS